VGQSVVFGHNDYRAYLREVFSERIQRNKAYSLRAFSNQIGIYPSHLSDIFLNKKHLSFQSGLKVSQKLGLDSDEVEYFCLLIQYATAKDQQVKDATVQRMSLINQFRPVENLSLDAFRMIADWYHIPILVMAELPSSQFTAKKISRRLGIKPIEVQTAIDRLLRLQLLSKSPDGSYKKTFTDGVFKSQHANVGLRHFHKAMLERAIEALEKQTNDEKLVGSETIIFDLDQMEEFKKMTEKYFTKAVNLGRSGKKRREVYHLGVQFFRLTERNLK
jgi:uncharacterized protein (TIGR02147 family)